MMHMGYGEVLKAAREKRDLSAEKLAERIGVSRVTIMDWESERAIPTRKFWDAIEQHLGLKLSIAARRPSAGVHPLYRLLRERRTEMQASLQELANRTGIPAQTLKAFEHSDAWPTQDQFKKLADVLGLDQEWSPDLRTLEAHQWAAPEVDSPYAYIKRLNLEVAAGSSRAEPEFEEVEHRVAYRKDWLARKGLEVSALVVVEAVGDSMYPTVCDGDSVLINTADRRLRNGQIYCFRSEDGPRLKRLVKQLDGRVRVVSDNPDKTLYPDEMLTPESEAVIIGVAVHRSGGI